jgi:hypothetical protein
MLSLMPVEDGSGGEPGHEPDLEYLEERERVGWLSVKVVAGTIVVILVGVWLVAALAGRR